MDIKRLRALTIILPLGYLILVELFSLFVLVPLFGNRSELRIAVVFLLLVVAAIPFSLWVFSMLEHQQRRLAENATVLENVRDYAIFLLNPEGRIMTWNPGAERVYGYHAEEIIGRHVSIFYLPADLSADRPGHILQAAATEGRFVDQSWRLRADGSHFWAEVVTTAVRDDAGGLTGYTQVIRDITERRTADERIRLLHQELEGRIGDLTTANEEVNRRNRQLAAINTAITSISGALDLPEVLQHIVDAARSLVESRYAALGVADENGRIMQFITSGITPEQRAAIGPLPQGHGLLGALISDARPLRIADIAQDPRSHGFPPRHPPMTSLLGVPILLKGKPVGDLYLTDKLGAEEFSAEDQELVMLLANHAAVAIENARLYGEVLAGRDRLQTWNRELEERVEERTAEIARYSKMLTTRVLQAQEEERKRIARELHDDAAQSLSTLMINLDLLQPQLPKDATVLNAGLERVRTIAKRTLDAIRALSHDLRPTILDDFGLAAALHWFADEFTRTFGVPVDIHTEEPPPRALSPAMELALFRIAQEALTNSGKYAGAERAMLSLTFTAGAAELVIADNGKGFDLATRTGPTREGGLGLYGMQERAELLGGQLTVQSSPGQGTRITAVIPFTDAEVAAATLAGSREK